MYHCIPIHVKRIQSYISVNIIYLIQRIRGPFFNGRILCVETILLFVLRAGNLQ